MRKKERKKEGRRKKERKKEEKKERRNSNGTHIHPFNSRGLYIFILRAYRAMSGVMHIKCGNSESTAPYTQKDKNGERMDGKKREQCMCV